MRWMNQQFSQMLLLTYTNSVVLNLLVVAVAVYYTTDARERVTDTSKKMI